MELISYVLGTHNTEKEPTSVWKLRPEDSNRTDGNLKERELAVKQREDAAISKAASLREARSIAIQRRKIEEMQKELLKVRKELAAESASMKAREVKAKRDEEQNELARKELAAESRQVEKEGTNTPR